MNWDQFPWLKEVLEDNSQDIVFRKSSQMGVSTAMIIWLLWICKTRKTPRGAIYWMPTTGIMRDFVSSKVDPFIDENLNIIDASVRDQTNNLGLKFIFNIPVFWRGLESKVGVKSISADAAIYDEYDEADPSQIKQAEQRLSASTIKLTRRLSVPTLPDYGIDKDFQLTDQCHFAFRCSCSTWNILEDNFPNCFQQNSQGEYYRACSKCKLELDIQNGQWVQKIRSQNRGYQISQLYSPFLTPNEIMYEYQTTEFVNHFYNHVLGLPYVSSTDRLTQEQIYALCDLTNPVRADSAVGTVMGLDQGSKIHWVVMIPGQRPRVLAMGECTDFEQVDDLIKRYKVREFAIDAMPETRKAKELLKRNPYKGWLVYYNENLKGDYSWREDDRIVSVNRTESLDVGTLAIMRGSMIMPRREKVVEEFALHCANIAKTVEENKDTGSKRYVYRRLGPDHYRHALNYAQIVASRSGSGGIVSIFR